MLTHRAGRDELFRGTMLTAFRFWLDCIKDLIHTDKRFRASLTCVIVSPTVFVAVVSATNLASLYVYAGCGMLLLAGVIGVITSIAYTSGAQGVVSQAQANYELYARNALKTPSVLPVRPKIDSMQSGYVYVLRGSQGRVKIGIAKDVSSRVATLQRQSSDTLHVIATKEFESPRSVEKELHRKYKSRRLHGEWFALSEAQVAEVKKLLE